MLRANMLQSFQRASEQVREQLVTYGNVAIGWRW